MINFFFGQLRLINVNFKLEIVLDISPVKINHNDSGLKFEFNNPR